MFGEGLFCPWSDYVENLLQPGFVFVSSTFLSNSNFSFFLSLSLSLSHSLTHTHTLCLSCSSSPWHYPSASPHSLSLSLSLVYTSALMTAVCLPLLSRDREQCQDILPHTSMMTTTRTSLQDARIYLPILS